MKPDAPDVYRGEFKPIATTVPGLRICEHLPRLAQRAHDLCLIRSMTHADVNHLTAPHMLLTGRPGPGGRARRRLAELRGGAGEDGPGPRPAPALRVDDAGRARRRAAVRGGDPRAGCGHLRTGSQPDADRRGRVQAGLPRRRVRAARGREREPTSRPRRAAPLTRRERPEVRIAGRRGSDGGALRPRVLAPLGAGRGAGVRPVARAGAGARGLRHEPARAERAPGAAAGRGGRAGRHRVLAERRHHQRERLLGHPQPQLPRPEDAAVPGRGPRVRRAARRSEGARDAGRDAGGVDGRDGPHTEGGPGGARRRGCRARRPRPLGEGVHQRAGRRRGEGRNRLRVERPVRGRTGDEPDPAGRPRGHRLPPASASIRGPRSATASAAPLRYAMAR